MMAVFNEASILNDEILKLGEDQSSSLIDDVKFEVDDCKSRLDEYLMERKDDASSIATWVQHQQQFFEPYINQELDDVVNKFSSMSIHHEEKKSRPKETDFPADTLKRSDLKKIYESRRLARNDVDFWIDNCDEVEASESTEQPNNPDQAFTSWIIQQSLPRIQIPFFDGYPTEWVPFIVKFYDMIQKQKYLTGTQKNTYLLQHLRGEAKDLFKVMVTTIVVTSALSNV